MTILVDEPRWWFRGRKWCHLVSDTSLDELHAFADAVGIPQRGFQGDHYDVPEEHRPTVVAAGAVEVESRELLRRLRAAGLRLSPAARRARSGEVTLPSGGLGTHAADPIDRGPAVARRPADGDVPVVRLERWTGPWPDDDKDANFKADVALYSTADPLRTIRVLSGSTGIPVGAVVRYVLARWASEGASGLLELGPTMVRRLHEVSAQAERVGTDEARLAAYSTLRQMLSWLVYPLDHPEVYGGDGPGGG